MNSSLEVNFARNILFSLLSSSYSLITKPFMDPIDPEKDNLKDYFKTIKEPICLNHMKAKMNDYEYQDIKEFICDFRLMLFNCYHYFGCDSKMGKLATKLESMFEQKLILLPIDIRLKTSIDAILMDETQSEIIESGMIRRRCSDRAFSTDIRLVTPIKAMMDELEKFGTISTMFSDNTEFQHDPINFLIEKLRRWQDKRRNQQLIRTFDDWFNENVLDIDIKVLNSCAEFIQVVQFISVGFQGLGLDLMLEEHLKLSHITIEDLEFALLFPQTSRLLCAIVPLITTTSKNRPSIIKSGPMNYDRWNQEIRERIKVLYKQWNEKRLCDNPDNFVKRFSIDPIIFKVLGNRRSITDKKQFHELTLFQRCHILLAMSCMSLRLQDTIHYGIDKSIDWDDHQVIVLGHIGQFEYVRFSGLGEFASYFIYRIRAREIDPELAKYCVIEDSINSTGAKRRKRKEVTPNKYRMPTWYAAEMKKAKSKKPMVTNKRKSKSTAEGSADRTPCGSWSTRSRRSKGGEKTVDTSSNGCDLISFIDNEVIEKTENVNCQVQDQKSVINDNHISSEAASVLTTNDEELGGDFLIDQDVEDEEEEIPEILTPKEDDFKLIARDLLGVVTFISETNEIIERGCCVEYNDEEIESYKLLLGKVLEIKQFFEINEANRVEKCNQSRLSLRNEIEKCSSQTIQQPLSQKSEMKTIDNGTDSVEYNDTNSESDASSSDDRYTIGESVQVESETTPPLASTQRAQQIDRTERFNRRQKRKLSDDEYKPPTAKQSRLENGSNTDNIEQQHRNFKPEVYESDPPIPAPEVAQTQIPTTNTTLTTTPQQIKKKVYRICDDYFTEDLEPVQINTDGTLVHLPRDLISSDRYELAGKMIAMYKSRMNGMNKSLTQNGTSIPMVSSTSS